MSNLAFVDWYRSISGPWPEMGTKMAEKWILALRFGSGIPEQMSNPCMGAHSGVAPVENDIEHVVHKYVLHPLLTLLFGLSSFSTVFPGKQRLSCTEQDLVVEDQHPLSCTDMGHGIHLKPMNRLTSTKRIFLQRQHSFC